MTRPSHASIVEEVAKALASFWPPHNPAQRNAAFDSSAEAAIAVIAARLSGVTLEMVEAWGRNTKLDEASNHMARTSHKFASAEASRVWRAMLAASALTPGDGNKE